MDHLLQSTRSLVRIAADVKNETNLVADIRLSEGLSASSIMVLDLLNLFRASSVATLR